MFFVFNSYSINKYVDFESIYYDIKSDFIFIRDYNGTIKMIVCGHLGNISIIITEYIALKVGILTVNNNGFLQGFQTWTGVLTRRGERVRGSIGSNRGSTGGIDPVYI